MEQDVRPGPRPELDVSPTSLVGPPSNQVSEGGDHHVGVYLMEVDPLDFVVFQDIGMRPVTGGYVLGPGSFNDSVDVSKYLLWSNSILLLLLFRTLDSAVPSC